MSQEMSVPPEKRSRGPYRQWMEPNTGRDAPRQTIHNDRRRQESASVSLVHSAASTNDSQNDAPSTQWHGGDDSDDTPEVYFDSGASVSSDTDEEAITNGDEDSNDSDNEFHAFLGAYSRETLPHQETTKGQAMLLILIYVVSAGLSWTQVDGLLRLINALFGTDVLPRSKYMLRKLWRKRQEGALAIHYFCSTCYAHLGTRARSTKGCTFTCSFCRVDHKQEKLLSSGSFFVIMDIKKRLQMLLKGVGAALLNRLDALASETRPQGVYTDITDGQLYKRARNNIGMNWCDFTVSFNSDGSPAFESTKSSVWPIQILINELPIRMRQSNTLICGLWFAKVHPPVHLFLNAFVQNFKNIGQIVWKALNRVVTSNVYAICCVADSPARASILNRKQFNGFYGCSWCLQRGVLVNGTLKYPAEPTGACLERTHTSVLKAMKLAVLRGKDVDGIKGPSPIVELVGLDVVWGVPPDYMHCVLLGVVKYLTELWMSSVGEPYYVGRKMGLINRRLCAIRPPISFTRLSRSLSEHAFWKATEWRNWVLYFMLPTLNGVLPVRYLVHASLLTESLFLLLQDSIKESDIDTADHLLQTFVHDTERLYGAEAARFNVHQLLHLAKTVRMLGPLWATSMFPFESGNGKILNLVTAAKSVPLQIAERVFMSETVREMDRHIPLPYHLETCAQRLQKAKETSVSCHGLGAASCNTQMTTETANLLFEKVRRNVSVEYFERAIINRIVVHTSQYARAQRTCSSYLKMCDGEFCEVRAIFSFQEQFEIRIALLCKQLLVVPSGLGHVTHIHKSNCPPASERMCMYLDNEVENQVIFVRIAQEDYICEQPNTCETD
ncbi:uncharacterized protein LOC135367607 [Ornithodoros turicata]|uniref:uncharacterized protein LOC135367607 n=1 Tax=Ornithodoros turicata TaxID=34597 RepID=UPI003138B1D2